jgi:hypothetical protein
MLSLPYRQTIQYISPSSQNNKSRLSSTSCSTSDGFGSKTVRFRLSESLYIEPPCTPDPPIEKSDLFYTKEELYRLGLECDCIVNNCIKEMYCLNSVDDLDSPIRGLEAQVLTPDHYRRGYTRKCSFAAVLNEQQRQRKECIFEPESLARLYMIFSRWTKIKARLAGQQDAQIAAKILSESRRDTTSDDNDEQ